MNIELLVEPCVMIMSHMISSIHMIGIVHIYELL